MKKLPFFVLLLALGLCACHETYTTNPEAQLAFSTDTLCFDTVFTQMSSITMQMRIYNRHKEALLIDDIRLREGKYFQLNVDGENDPTQLHDLTLRGGDSLFVFVKATIDPLNQANPALVEDAILFHTNQHEQQVCLQAYGQDVEILRQYTLHQDTVLGGSKPYLVYDYLLVDTACTLTLLPGTTFYLHDNAEVVLLGSLHAEGTLEQPIRFRGDRLDEFFIHVPYTAVAGKWNGIYLLQPQGTTSATQHLLNHVEIISGQVGLQCQAYPTDPLPQLQLTNSRIHNFSVYGLVLRNVQAEIANTEISNCATYCLYLQGGEYYLAHNTIASYFRSTDMQIQPVNREDVAAVFIDNLSKDNAPTHAYFYNNLIAGIRSNNLVLATPLPNHYTGAFYNNYLAADSMQVGYFQNNVYAGKRDTLFVNTFYSHTDFLYYDFHLDSVSPARNIGDLPTAQKYPLDREGHSRLQDEAPDAGCYEWQPLPLEP